MVPLSVETSLQRSSGIARFVEAFLSIKPAHMFIHEWNEPHLPLPSQPKLVLIYQPWKNGWLSWDSDRVWVSCARGLMSGGQNVRGS